jgi:hypothetical protein
VDGRNPAPADRWQTFHYLEGFNHPFGGAGFLNHPQYDQQKWQLNGNSIVSPSRKSPCLTSKSTISMAIFHSYGLT